MIADQRATTLLERLGTGSPTLDHILGGGLPARSVIVVAGEPGSGKTVFTLQMLFHHAREGRKCLYFSTLSEPSLKLFRYIQLYSFFAPELLDDGVLFADLGSTLRAEGAARALAEVAERVEEAEPDFVAIDSFRAIHDLLGEPARGRALVYDLAVQTAGWGAITLLVGEYTPQELGAQPEFAIADGIIRLTKERQELSTVRELEVLKLRGAGYIAGRHFFEISADGLSFYPRVQAPKVVGPPVPLTDRVSTGVRGLDDLLCGGLPRTSSTIVHGGTGVGKTLLGLQFLLDGARQGEPGILFTLEEAPGQLREVARTFGWDLAAQEAAGLLFLEHISPVELSPDRFFSQVQERVEALGARRMVLDSLTSTMLGVPSERRLREFVYALTKYSRAAGVTLLMTMEVTELLGSAHLTGRDISNMADNIILMRYVEMEAQLERAASVLKVRGVHHRRELYRVVIDEGGLQVGPPFAGVRGVLTGHPVPTQTTSVVPPSQGVGRGQ
jgi:circadian clock protein KaiC